jgi:hypothetical protein
VAGWRRLTDGRRHPTREEEIFGGTYARTCARHRAAIKARPAERDTPGAARRQAARAQNDKHHAKNPRRLAAEPLRGRDVRQAEWAARA